MNFLVMDKRHWLSMNESSRLDVAMLCHTIALHDIHTNLYEIKKNLDGDQGLHVTTDGLKVLLTKTENDLNPRLFDY